MNICGPEKEQESMQWKPASTDISLAIHEPTDCILLIGHVPQVYISQCDKMVHRLRHVIKKASRQTW